MFKALALLGSIGIFVAVYLSDLLYVFRHDLNPPSSEGNRLFTAEELALFDGIQAPFLYLAILGTVFNVTKGLKHYGVGQQYHFFLGKDASRNFITGKFEERYQSDDVGDLNQEELRSLNNWLNFYKKEYKKVGKLVGRYFDEFGRLTPYARQIKKRISEAEKSKQHSETLKEKFPPCNMEWDAKKGTRVWCTSKSGGVQRSWVGKPRQYYDVRKNTFVCVCIGEENESLYYPVRKYPGCEGDSESCFVEI